MQANAKCALSCSPETLIEFSLLLAVATFSFRSNKRSVYHISIVSAETDRRHSFKLSHYIESSDATDAAVNADRLRIMLVAWQRISLRPQQYVCS